MFYNHTYNYSRSALNRSHVAIAAYFTRGSSTDACAHLSAELTGGRSDELMVPNVYIFAGDRRYLR